MRRKLVIRLAIGIVLGVTILLVYQYARNTNPERLTLGGRAGEVTGVAISPDGERIVSAARRGMKVWDARTGEELLSFEGSQNHHCIAFSPDGQRIVSGGGTTLTVRDARSGEKRRTLRGKRNDESNAFPGVREVAFSPDGKHIVSGGSDTWVRVWDADTGEEKLILTAHTGRVTGVAFSPDGQRIASSSSDETVRVWDAKTGKEKLTLAGGARLLSVAFSPDGQRVAAVGNGTLRVWDARTGVEVLSKDSGYGPVAFSPDGTRIVSGGGDMKRYVSVWSSRTGEHLLRLEGHTGFVTDVAFSPDGEWIVSASEDGTLKVWDANPGWGFLRW